MFATPVTNSKVPLSPDTPAKHKPILAERFKTKMCRTWTDKGECPYEFRCMFAHGDEDLRTKAMNVADGLTTDEAIRAFQYASAPSGDSTPTSPARPSDETPVASAKPAPLEPSNLLRFVAALTSPAKDQLATPAVSPATSPRMSAGVPPPLLNDTSSEQSCATPTPSLRRYRHDPYAPVVMGPPTLLSTSYSYGACAVSSPVSPIVSTPSRISSGHDLDVAGESVLRSTSPATTYGAFASLPSPARSYAAAASKLDSATGQPRIHSTYGPKTTYCAA